MKRMSTLCRSGHRWGIGRRVSVARHSKEEAAKPTKENALTVSEPLTEEEADVWAEASGGEGASEDIFQSSAFDEFSGEHEATFALQEQQAPTNEQEEISDALIDFLNCIKQVKGTVTEDVQTVSRELARHSAGVTSAKSFAELQHHVSEIVQLSGPELGCAWSTVKVGVGVASVLSGNLLVGSFMVALAAGSLGTSLVWKAHRDSRRSPAALTKTEEDEEMDNKSTEEVEGNTQEGYVNLRKTEDGAAEQGCVSPHLRKRQNSGSRVRPFSKYNKVKGGFMQLASGGKEVLGDSVGSGEANEEQPTEYDAWSGEG
ncbi:hypothetical protein, conserved [Eimeria brunetti]|uniref:Uncharacterized protein n=1 Tax=Eimeria brunetti TaxID=51314 RepID=U6LSM1_9EIME|nr:hypothetical protein, conserved [Eimeria brunetti]